MLRKIALAAVEALLARWVPGGCVPGGFAAQQTDESNDQGARGK
jgi:hypothetical protein